MRKTIHLAKTRGYFDHGWLKTNHTFSFGHYYDPDRTHFGKLRVLNDDFVAPGEGFGTHSHENMEIVSIPLSGELGHRDSTGHEEVIRPTDIQVMSAGTGIRHSEYNHSKDETVNFLQIWVLPDGDGHEPRYDQKTFNPSERENRFQSVIAPQKQNGHLWLNQDAYFSLSDIEGGKSVEYTVHKNENGLYLFVIEGELKVAEENLKKRDGIGIWDFDKINIQAITKSEVLVIEIPMA